MGVEVFVAAIKRDLKRRKWSSHKLACEAGLAPSTVHRILSGQRRTVSFDTVAKIADTLELRLFKNCY